VTKVYPVFSAVGFDYSFSTATQSICADKVKFKLREDLIKASLRYGIDKKQKSAPE